MSDDESNESDESDDNKLCQICKSTSTTNRFIGGPFGIVCDDCIERVQRWQKGADDHRTLWKRANDVNLDWLKERVEENVSDDDTRMYLSSIVDKLEDIQLTCAEICRGIYNLATPGCLPEESPDAPEDPEKPS